MFEIHPQLNKDCFVIGKFKLCYLLLMNDSNYPWFILVPEKDNIKEIFELSKDEQHQLLHEISFLAELLDKEFNADKMNIAALGNVVPQLHVHIIVRHTGDPAWASPVWGKVPAKEYTETEKQKVISRLKLLLKEDFNFYL